MPQFWAPIRIAGSAGSVVTPLRWRYDTNSWSCVYNKLKTHCCVISVFHAIQRVDDMESSFPQFKGGSRILVWGTGRAEGARIHAPLAPNGGGVWPTPLPHWGKGLGRVPLPRIFLILGSRNAYFVAFSGPPESDSVVPAIGRVGDLW